MRIALICPYSWTYPGGVSRHVEALGGELLAKGHDVKVLAPFDPDDELARRLHSGARPEGRTPPEHLVSLGRTLGVPANGAVSNLSLFPEAMIALRRELREGGYDVAHIHEPVVPIVSWDAVCCATLPLVGTFHTYSDNLPVNLAARAVGAARRMNRLHVRIAVSEAAAWTARRFFGGTYRVIPNGVDLGGPAARPPAVLGLGGLGPWPAGERAGGDGGPLRILFVGQAVERKGLPVLLKAFEAVRDHVPATLTLVGAGREDVAPLLLDDRGVVALGKVSEEEKARELAGADVLCAPSLGGESFGMVLTEAFAAATPVVASDITGYRDVARDGLDGVLVPPGDPVALAEALRSLALDPERRLRMAAEARRRAERFAWERVAEEVVDAYGDAIAVGEPEGRVKTVAVRLGLAPADLMERVPPQRIGSLEGHPVRRRAGGVVGVARRAALAVVSLAVLGLAAMALKQIGVAKVVTSLLASQPGLVGVGVGLMCVAMVARALAWDAILAVAPTWRRARLADALQGTFIGVLMSASLPARMGETARALVVARRIGRAHESLPAVEGTIVFQAIANLLALLVLGIVSLLTVRLRHGEGFLVALTVAPVAAVAVAAVGPAIVAVIGGMAGIDGGEGRRWLGRLREGEGAGDRERLAWLWDGAGVAFARVRQGVGLARHRRQAGVAVAIQMGAWGLQLLACWVVLKALGLSGQTGIRGAVAVLFAVNVTAMVPATPANVGVFQAACVAVLAGAFHVSGADALAYGIVLQAVELATAAVMGMPALVREGISWRQLRLRTIHASPVRLAPLGKGSQAAAGSRISS